MSYTSLIDSPVDGGHVTNLPPLPSTIDIPTKAIGQQSAEDLLFPCSDPEVDPSLWESAGRRRLEQLIGRSQVNRILLELAQQSFAHLRGLPIDTSPPATPYDHEPNFQQIGKALANLFGLIGALNLRAFAFGAENGGRIVRHVAPRFDSSDEISSHGWKHELSWHIDGAYRPLGKGASRYPEDLSSAPEWLLWSVIYDTPEVPITLVSVDELLHHLPVQIIANLQKPEFDVESPDSFGQVAVTRRVPLLIPDPRGGFFCRYNQLKCKGLTSNADAALAAVASALEEGTLIKRLAIKAGDIVIIYNWKMLHMRSPFAPLWNGKDRWLVRIYAATSGNRGKPSNPAKPRVWR
jgi:L-asparagine oxygenase